MISANLSGVQQKKYMEYDDGYNSKIFYSLYLLVTILNDNNGEMAIATKNLMAISPV